MNLSELDESLQEHADNDGEVPSHCWELSVNSLGVVVNAAAKGSHLDQDDALADATNLAGHLIEAGFIRYPGPSQQPPSKRMAGSGAAAL